MKNAAVAVISYFDNEIKQCVVSVTDDASWKDAYASAINNGIFGDKPDADQTEWVMSLPDNMDEARAEANNGEMDFCVTWF